MSQREQLDLFATVAKPGGATLEDLTQMQALLQRWVERRWLRALDAQLPQTLHQLSAEPNPLIWLLCALALPGAGHGCGVTASLREDDLGPKSVDWAQSGSKGLSQPAACVADTPSRHWRPGGIQCGLDCRSMPSLVWPGLCRPATAGAAGFQSCAPARSGGR